MILSSNEIVIASRNEGKIREFAARFEKLGKTVKGLNQFKGIPTIHENGSTFAANAEIKAKFVARAIHKPVLADDSGLCVDALNGAPGVLSARYAGEHASDEENNTKLLKSLYKIRGMDMLAQRPDLKLDEDWILLSKARFVCALALYDPVTDQMIRVEASYDGEIIHRPRGDGGFGYDPLLYVSEFGKTMAELSMEEKNANSHRGRAIDSLLVILAGEHKV
jgi:XTP/dITP diphosphohydrolase